MGTFIAENRSLWREPGEECSRRGSVVRSIREGISSFSSNNTIASSTFSRVGLLDSMVLCCMGNFSDSDSSSDSDEDGGSDTDDGSEAEFDILQVEN